MPKYAIIKPVKNMEIRETKENIKNLKNKLMDIGRSL